MTEGTNRPTEAKAQLELKQVLGALLFASRKPITVDELREVLAQVDQNGENADHPFGKIKEGDIRTALEQLKTETAERNLGIIVVEVAGGFRFQTDPTSGPWVRHLLNLDKPARLSKPALETLAIIAYRQPATRAEIEALRGVNVDAMMRHLLELQLIRIMGRSDLPGRPLMYGTTQLFLEHFGLSSVKNLPGIEQLSRRDAERVKRETGGGRTDDGRQIPDTGPEKTADGLTTDAEPEKTEEANAQHPTPGSAEALRPGESNTQLPMEEQKTDDPQRKAEGVEAEAEEEDEYDEEDNDEEDKDEDEDEEEGNEGRK